VYLVGNSFGGLIAARMAVVAPDRVAGLVLVEASCAGAEASAWLENMTNTLTLGALRLEYDHEENRLASFDGRRFRRQAAFADTLLNGTSLIDDLAMERPLSAPELEAIRCPVIAVFGDHSELVGAADELRRHVRDCRIEILPGVAHTVLREATEPLRDILVSWLPAAEAVR
jgi:pimeloyl-ACP methyl ester carboxylesterase